MYKVSSLPDKNWMWPEVLSDNSIFSNTPWGWMKDRAMESRNYMIELSDETKMWYWTKFKDRKVAVTWRDLKIRNKATGNTLREVSLNDLRNSIFNFIWNRSARECLLKTYGCSMN